MPASSKTSPEAKPLRIVLFIEESGGVWHADQLTAALQASGSHVITTTLKRCAFDTSSRTGLVIPGLEDELPDGAFVRSISSGTLEQTTFRLGILHALRESGVRVWNDARVIERCVDKSTATFLFNKRSLPVPATRTLENEHTAHDIAAAKAPLVCKPMFGSQGNGIKRVNTPSDLPDPSTLGNVFYLQDYVHAHDTTSFSDWRVLVSGGRVLAAMTRSGTSWITNVHQGATPKAADITPEMSHLALGAVQAIGADYAGVDLIKGPDNKLMILEINSNPAWKGLQSVTGVDIGRELASDFLKGIHAHQAHNTTNAKPPRKKQKEPTKNARSSSNCPTAS